MTTEGAEFAEEVNLSFRVFRVFRSFFVFLGSGPWPGYNFSVSLFRERSQKTIALNHDFPGLPFWPFGMDQEQ